MTTIDIEKDFNCKASQSGAVIFAPAETWRRLSFYVVLCASFVLLLFATAANAQVSEIIGDFSENRDRFLDIDKKPIVSTRCRQAGAESREQMGWYLEDASGNKVATGWTPNPSYTEPLHDPLDLAKFTVPGQSYLLVSYCTADHFFKKDYDEVKRRFKVNPLSGSADFSVNYGKVKVTGFVGNGANRVVIYADGEQVAERKVTGNFSIEFDGQPGTRDFTARAYYEDVHFTPIGSAKLGVVVHDAPKVSIDALPQFTNNENIVFSGRATSASGFKTLFFRARKSGGGLLRNGSPRPTQEKEIPFKEEFRMNSDGRYEFMFQAQGKDNKWGESEVFTVFDRKAPDITITNRPKGDIVGAGTKILVNVRDLNMEKEDGAGAQLVQVEAIDKNGKSSGWKTMSLESGTDIDGEYGIVFDELFNIHDLPEGDVLFKFWAKDKAGNDAYGPEVTYKKTSRPLASVAAVKKYVTKGSWAYVNVKATAKTKITKVQLEIQVFEKGSRTYHYYEDIGSKYQKWGMNTVSFYVGSHSMGIFDESTVLVRAIAESEDGQRSDPEAEPAVVIRDTRAPTVNLSLPYQEGDKFAVDQEIRFKVEDEYGSGVKDVQTQICQGEENCSIWFKDIENDGEGSYSQKLPLADFSSGEFTLKVWAVDKAGNSRTNEYKFIKERLAAEVLTTEMSFAKVDGNPATGSFYFDETRRLRLFVDSKAESKGVTVAYSLPDGLSLAGKAALKGRFSAALAGAGKQVENWTGSGNLLTDIDIGKDENIVIDIPVKMTKKLPRPKVGIDRQVTSFEVTGKNFDGASRAETTWRADWKKDPADVNAPASKRFDLSKPEDIVLFDKVSGGYDTGKAPKWNRNTLHCRSGQAQCQKFPDYTGIKLRFTEQASQKTVDLNLRGNRDQTSTKDGRPTRSGALDVQTNPGGEAGVDAEVRFSVTIPKSELARLPIDGQWRAELIMDMKDAAGKDLAVFKSDITLDVTDENDLSLKPPRIELLEGSHMDNNGSGDFSAGDEVVYRITYVASRDLNRVSLDLTLAPGLEPRGNLRNVAGGVVALLSDGWRKGLMQQSENLKQGQKLVIDLPLRIRQDGGSRLVSQVHAWAEGFDSLPSNEAVLNVQRRFDVSEGLGLTMEMLGQPDANAEAVVAQQAPFTYRIVLSSRKHALEGLKMAYRLPGGMQMNGKPVLHPIPELADVKLNAQWNGDADIELFAAGAKLLREQSITIDIPVMVKEVVEDGVSVQSTFSAGAKNLDGELSKSHKVRTRERETGGGHRVKIVKSMEGDAVAQPGAQIRYQIRVSNHTFKTVRNLLIRDRAPDHTTLTDASCGNLPTSACRVLKLGDKAVEEGTMTHAALCKGGAESDSQGQHVFWCLDGDLEPLADYTVNYSVRITNAAPAASASAP